jgi:hypothetical protein
MTIPTCSQVIPNSLVPGKCVEHFEVFMRRPNGNIDGICRNQLPTLVNRPSEPSSITDPIVFQAISQVTALALPNRPWTRYLANMAMQVGYGYLPLNLRIVIPKIAIASLAVQCGCLAVGKITDLTAVDVPQDLFG